MGRLLQAKLDDHQTHPRIDKATGLRLQTKLKVNELGDIYEQEAERVTNQVMGAPGHSSVSGAPPRIQRVSGQPNGQVDAVPASVDQVLGSPGRPLEPMLRQDMEQRFGHDFSQVRVHTGAAAEQSAREVNSDAYTVGHDVVFGAGRFAPAAREGRHLLAHELTHVMQQRSASMVQRAPPRRRVIGCEPWPAKLPLRGKTDLKPKGRDIAIEYSLAVNPGHFCETPPNSVAVLQYERQVWIRTASGHEAFLHIQADTSFFPPFDPNKSDFEQLRTAGYVSLRWEVSLKYSKDILKKQGFDIAEELTHWRTPRQGRERAVDHNQSLAVLAKQQPPLVWFFLSPAEQQEYLEDFVNQSAAAEIPELRKRFQEWQRKRPPQHKKPQTPPVRTPPEKRGGTRTGPSKRAREVVKAADKATAQVIEAVRASKDGQAVEETTQDGSDPWEFGLLRALAAIGLGLVALAAVAAVVAGAVFIVTGVVLSATAAIAVAAAILLVHGFVTALRHRAGQSAYKGRPGAGIGRSFLDAIGVTGVQEAWTGKDVANRRKLTPGERTERGTLGGVNILTLLLGARTALKKAPAGAGDLSTTPALLPDIAELPTPREVTPPAPHFEPRRPTLPVEPPKPESPQPTEPPVRVERPKSSTKSFDERIAEAEAALNESRRKAIEYQERRVAEGKSRKGGPIKDVWNQYERLWVLKRQMAYPQRLILEQAEIVGVRTADGQVVPSEKIAGERRILDFAEFEGRTVRGGDLKSKQEMMKSVKGGYKNPKDVPGEFSKKSKIGKQLDKENAIVEFARVRRGKLLIRGRDVKTGEQVTREVDVDNYSSTVIPYSDIQPN